MIISVFLKGLIPDSLFDVICNSFPVIRLESVIELIEQNASDVHDNDKTSVDFIEDGEGNLIIEIPEGYVMGGIADDMD